METKRVFYEQISSWASISPQSIAMETSNAEAITYAELDARSNWVASQLLDKKGSIVGVYAKNGIDYVLGILGVAKAGAAFLPLDPDLPMDRINEYLAISNCDTILVSEKAAEFLRVKQQGKQVSGKLIYIENKSVQKCQEVQILPNDPAYVMFTSGSSGKPKAVLGNHKGLSHFLRWEATEFAFDNSLRVSWLAPTTFDVSLRDILLPLVLGGTLCIPTEEERSIPHLLVDWLKKLKVNLVHCVPTVLRLLTLELEESGKKLPDLRFLLSAGEPLYMRDVVYFIKNATEGTQMLEVVNVYGPTETTLAKAFYRVPISDDMDINDESQLNTLLPIGNPLPNTSLLILDGDRLCDPLEIGEIYIRTPYKTLGYINEPEIELHAFVVNPLTNLADDIIYKSGDMGRYLENGCIECLGRRDNQIKINGIRIDLGEIECAMKDIAEILDATVTSFEVADKQKELVGYVTIPADSEISRESVGEMVRNSLFEKLPSAYVPARIFIIDAIPYTTSGKVNRRLLPKPDAIFYTTLTYTAPETEIEKSLCAIWQEIFNREKISTSVSFAAFGGDSLRGIKALSMIYKVVGINIPLEYFFSHHTIQELAAFINNTEK